MIKPLVSELLDKLSRFRHNANQGDFEKIFGKENNQGPHLWRRWNNEMHNDLVFLWGCLNKQEKDAFLAYLDNFP